MKQQDFQFNFSIKANIFGQELFRMDAYFNSLPRSIFDTQPHCGCVRLKKDTPCTLSDVCMGAFHGFCPAIFSCTTKLNNIRSPYSLIEQSINFLTAENITSLSYPDTFCLIHRPM